MGLQRACQRGGKFVDSVLPRTVRIESLAQPATRICEISRPMTWKI